MADTGAPWNIPFVEPTDIPRGYPADSEDLALAIAAGLTNARVIVQVKSVSLQTAFSTASTSYVDITGLTLDITPTSDTNKVLVIANVQMGHSGAASAVVRLARGGSAITTTPHGWGFVPSEFQMVPIGMTFFDEPGVDTQVTYSVQTKNGFDGGGTAFVNRRGFTTDPTITSTLTLIEVAA